MALISYSLTLESQPSDILYMGGSAKPNSIALSKTPLYLSLLGSSSLALLDLQVGSAEPNTTCQVSSKQMAPEVHASAEIIRDIGSALDHFLGRFRDIQLLRREILCRLDLQKKESHRLRERHIQLLSNISNSQSVSLHFNGRLKVKNITKQQHLQLFRTGHMLQSLFNSIPSEKNDFENKWVSELIRMKTKIVGCGHQDITSLHGRLQCVGILK